jgi:hypothetical protein
MPLAARAGAFLVFVTEPDAPAGLTIAVYDYDVAARVGAIQHGTLLRPCAPPGGGAQDTCEVAASHAHVLDPPLAPGHYIIVVTVVFQRERESGYSEQGFNVVVRPYRDE